MLPFAVFIFGENYLLEMQNTPARKYSFYVWRCVEATTQEEAEYLALQSVCGDESLAKACRNQPGDEPQLIIIETRHGFGDLTPPGSGFIFVDEDEPQLGKGWIAKVVYWFSSRRTQMRTLQLPDE